MALNVIFCLPEGYSKAAFMDVNSMYVHQSLNTILMLKKTKIYVKTLLNFNKVQICNSVSGYGSWSVWSPWSICSRTCQGNQERRRSCRGGSRCIGPAIDFRLCKARCKL